MSNINFVPKEVYLVTQLLTDLFTPEEGVTMVAAGGCLRDPIINQNVNHPYKDIDICVSTKQEPQLIVKRINEACSRLHMFQWVQLITSYEGMEMQGRGVSAVLKLQHLVGYMCVDIDVIVYEAEDLQTPQEIISKFDLDVCQVGFYNGGLITTSAFENALHTQSFKLINRQGAELSNREILRIKRIGERLPHFGMRDAQEIVQSNYL